MFSFESYRKEHACYIIEESAERPSPGDLITCLQAEERIGNHQPLQLIVLDLIADPGMMVGCVGRRIRGNERDGTGRYADM